MRSTKNIAYFISFICCYFALSVSSATAPIVDLGYAQYQGVPYVDPINNTTNTQFLALRYGAPPTGSQRFRKPEPPTYTPGVQLANKQPIACFQAPQGVSPTSSFRNVTTSTIPSVDLGQWRGTDDCLFLNVYVPGDLGEKKDLPVVVWIHGGGYGQGNASEYPGNDLVQGAGGGVVAVIIQYRLGLFGFLAGEKVEESGALNAGLLDQQAALQWVQTHISKFGGDPTKVTLWGESAGGGGVLQHIIANDGNTRPPLFRAAMTSEHATFLPSQYRYNDRIPELLYSEVVNRTGCSSAQDTLDCLRAVDASSLQRANVEMSDSAFFGTFAFQPVVDGSFITRSPTELLKAGRVNGGIFLSVTNAFEGTEFVNLSTAATVQVADYVSQLFPNFTPEEINAVVTQYADFGQNISKVKAIMGESNFLCPTYLVLRAFQSRGYKGVYGIPAGPLNEDVFYYYPNILGSPITTFGKSLSGSFLDFAMTLDPNTKWDPSNVTPTWGLWNGATEMFFNKTEAGDPDIHSVTTSSAMLKRCEFWQSISGLTSQ